MPARSYLPLLEELVRSYQAFETFSGLHIRELGLTPCQFDIVATLGNTDGMSFRELGEKTLITKGTLTGVVDRLAGKNLVRRVASPTDGRSQLVQLTAKGEKLFAEAFPAHLSHLDRVFSSFGEAEQRAAIQVLHRLRIAFEAAGGAA